MSTPVTIKVRHARLEVTTSGQKVTRKVQTEPHASATVSLVKRASLAAGAKWPYAGLAATHTHKADGTYEAPSVDLETETEWLLVVHGKTKDGKPATPVVQWLTVNPADATKKKPLTLRPGWKDLGDLSREKDAEKARQGGHPDRGRQAAAVDLVGVTAKGSAASASGQHITVDLYERREVVLLNGINYDGKANFFPHILARRPWLWRRGLVDDGTLFTLLLTDCPRAPDPHQGNLRRTFVKAVKGEEWLEVDRETGWGAWKDFKAHLDAGSGGDYAGKHPLAGPDLYRYLERVGADAPGTVQEVSVYSHAYQRGPILYNTNQRPGYTSSTQPRDPDDLDLREKDWTAAGWTKKPLDLAKVKAAFRGDATLHAWGCNVKMDIIRSLNAVQKANGDAGDSKPVVIHRAWSNAPREEWSALPHHAILDLLADDLRRVPAYMANAARLLGLACYGAPPGMEGNFATEGGLPIMWVDPDGPALKDNKKGMMHRPSLRFYEKRLGLVPDGKNYVDYGALTKALEAREKQPIPFHVERWGKLLFTGPPWTQQWVLPTGVVVRGDPTDALPPLAAPVAPKASQFVGAAPPTTSRLYLAAGWATLSVGEVSRIFHATTRKVPLVTLTKQSGARAGLVVAEDGTVTLYKAEGAKLALDDGHAKAPKGVVHSGSPAALAW
ncbi:MAG: hypothetical protein M9894_24025 [Planctomycetes bacterium]|nr:hypothetical protein [Planctomycetota bacterium]